jgi:hypothetical protein
MAELAIGRARFRIDYFPPGDASIFERDDLEDIAESVLFNQSNVALMRGSWPADETPLASVAEVRPTAGCFSYSPPNHAATSVPLVVSAMVEA